MSYSACVIRCNRCGTHVDVDLSSRLCAKCRVMQRRAEDSAFPQSDQNQNNSSVFKNLFR